MELLQKFDLLINIHLIHLLFLNYNIYYVKLYHYRFSKSDGEWALHKNICAVRNLKRTDFITPGNKVG